MVFVLGCKVHKHSGKTKGDSIVLDTLEVKAKKGPLVYRAKPTKVWEITNTKVALGFNWAERTTNAQEWIDLHPYCYATDTLCLDAKGMKIETVELADPAGNTPLKYTYENDELKINFGRSYRLTDSIQIHLRYTAMPYGSPTGGSKAITEDRGLYFINTDQKTPRKPVEIWTQGESEANSHWMITIDKPNTRFTTQIELTVPDTMVTLSNGAMVAQKQ